MHLLCGFKGWLKQVPCLGYEAWGRSLSPRSGSRSSGFISFQCDKGNVIQRDLAAFFVTFDSSA
jgi:hypothetical protein